MVVEDDDDDDQKKNKKINEKFHGKEKEKDD